MRYLNQVTRLAIEDRVIAALKEKGLASTGQLRLLSGPHFQELRRWCACNCRQTGHWRSDGVYDVTRSAAPTILQILKRLERQGLVCRIEPPIRNNHGGYQWLWTGSLE